MWTSLWCAVLAAAAWIVYLSSSGHEAALVFATVWTAMSLAYAGRVRRGRRTT